jgi:hypothetical protein
LERKREGERERERERGRRSARNEGSNGLVKLFMGGMQKMTETIHGDDAENVHHRSKSIHSNRMSSSAKPVRDKSRTSIN